MNKFLIVWLVVLILIIVGGYILVQNYSTEEIVKNVPVVDIGKEENISVNNVEQTTTPSIIYIQGMKIETIKEGTGQVSKTGDRVFVHYVGTLLDGKKFDSSVDRGTPFDFYLGQNRVIQGWELGVLGMKVGEKRKLTIPPELGYGAQAVSVIPANSTLLFDVELLEIQ